MAGDFDLVVNAGVMLPSPAEVSDVDDLSRMIDANVVGAWSTPCGRLPAPDCWRRASAARRPTSS